MTSKKSIHGGLIYRIYIYENRVLIAAIQLDIQRMDTCYNTHIFIRIRRHTRRCIAQGRRVSNY